MVMWWGSTALIISSQTIVLFVWKFFEELIHSSGKASLFINWDFFDSLLRSNIVGV